MALDVIGVGLGRTSTLSLKVALGILGLRSCYHRLVFCIAACLASPIGAQTSSASIYVDDPRPVAEAIRSLLDRHPVVITYEDPRFEYSGDIKDVTDAIRRSPAPPGTRRTLVPRGGILQMSYDVAAATGEPADMRETLRRILEANDVGPAGGRFKVLESGAVFHVVPTAIRDATGAWAAQPSVLDVPITLSVQEVNGFQLLDAIAGQIKAASGAAISAGGENLTNTLARYRGRLEATDEPARDVLVRALHANQRAPDVEVVLRT